MVIRKQGVVLKDSLERYFNTAASYLGKTLVGAFSLFIFITLIEGRTGFLSHWSGQAWWNTLERLPSSMAQGDFGRRTLQQFIESAIQNNHTNFVLVADSNMAPDLGGGSRSELSSKDLVSQHLKNALNLSFVGGEWFISGEIIRDLIHNRSLQEQQPVLITLVNFKFFATREPFTPHPFLGLDYCRNDLSSSTQQICEHLRTTPGYHSSVLSHISRFSPWLFSSLIGHLDFLMTFFQRTPVHISSVGGAEPRGKGRYGLRTFRSGIMDALQIEQHFLKNPDWADPKPEKYTRSQVSAFLLNIIRQFKDPSHPKHRWLKFLSDSVHQWHGPRLVIWLPPSPLVNSVLSVDEQAAFEEMGNQVKAVFLKQGEPQTRVISIQKILDQESDYVESDHFTKTGHKRLAQWITQEYGK